MGVTQQESVVVKEMGQAATFVTYAVCLGFIRKLRSPPRTHARTHARTHTHTRHAIKIIRELYILTHRDAHHHIKVVQVAVLGCPS